MPTNRSRTDSQSKEYVEQVLQSIEKLNGDIAREFGQTVTWNNSTDHKASHNNLVQMIWASSRDKFTMLTTGLVHAIRQSNYILYALVSRSIIEYAATIWYYKNERSSTRPKGSNKAFRVVKKAETQKVFDILEKQLKARRFDWDNYLKNVRTSKLDQKDDFFQKNVLTCIEKWDKDKNGILELYEMFCDMVHPNLGGTILVLRTDGEVIGFGNDLSESHGDDILIDTLPRIYETISYLSTLILDIRDERIW